MQNAIAQDNADITRPVISVEKPFVRSTPPGHKVSGAFMLLRNLSAEDIDLVAASSPVSRATEIHATRMRDGVMRMQHIGKITIPAHASIELKPGGLHVMLMGLKQPLQEGESIKLELKFSNQTTQIIDVPVVRLNR